MKNKITHSIHPISQTSQGLPLIRTNHNHTIHLQSSKKQKEIDILLEKLPNRIRLKMNDLTGTLRFLRGNLMPLVADSASFHHAREEQDHEGMGIAVVEELSGVMNIDHPKEELQVERLHQDDLNMTHIFFQQVYKEIPIWGAQVGIHFDENLSPIEVSGVYPPTLSFLLTEVENEITEQKAVAHAKKAVNISASMQVPVTVQRIIYWDLNKKPTMTFLVNLTPSWEYDWRVFVSTSDGEVIHRYNATQD